MEEIGQQAAVSIIVHLFFIALTWWALLAVNIDPLIRKGKVIQARVLMIIITIAVGSTVSNFSWTIFIIPDSFKIYFHD